MSAWNIPAYTPPAEVPPTPVGVADLYWQASIIADRASALAKASLASERASKARAKLDAGASRASITTANAKWARAAEHRERCLQNLLHALHVTGFAKDAMR